jgi:AhpD family alkylhydroperoxidase
MARIAGLQEGDAEEQVKLAYRYARQGMAELTGADAERGIEPLEMYAHAPALLAAVGTIEQATAELGRVDQRLKDLAELKAAMLTGCEYCIDLGAKVARRSSLSNEQLLALPRYQSSPLFNGLEKLVFDYAVGVSRTPVAVPDELFAALRAHFDDAQLVELTHVIALENMRGRFNLALGIGAAGFSEGMVCALPASGE